MKKIGIISILLVSLLTFTACGKDEAKKKESEKKNETSQEESMSGKKAVDFQLKDLEGNIVKLDDFKGKKLLIEFWASWCHVCNDNLPHMEEISAKADKGFEVVTVIAPNMFGEKTVEDFKTWFEEKGYGNIKVLVDEGGKLMKSYGVRAFPTNVIIDSKHNVDSVIPGAIPQENLFKMFDDLK